MIGKSKIYVFSYFKELFLTVFCSIFAFFSLCSYYSIVESDIFAYLNRPTLPDKQIIYFLPIIPLVILGAIIIFLKKKSHLSVMLDYLFVFYLIPSFIISSAHKDQKDWIFECVLKFIVFIIFSVTIGNKEHVNIQENFNKKSLYKYSYPAIVLIVVTILGYNLTTVAFDLNRVYEVRFAARDLSSGGNSLSDHSPNFLIYFFGPILISIGVGLKKKLIFILGLFSMILPFMAIASKSAIFLLGIAFFVGLVYNKIFKYRHWHLPAIMILLIGIAQSAYVYFDDFWLPSFFSRMFIIPSISTEYYIEFGNIRGFYYFEDWNIISNFYDLLGISKSFSDSKGFVIGNEYYSGNLVNLNSTIWANAYLDFGFLGVVIFTILFALILRMLTPRKDDSRVDKLAKIVIMYVYTYLSLEKSANGYILGAGLVFAFLYYLSSHFKILER